MTAEHEDQTMDQTISHIESQVSTMINIYLLLRKKRTEEAYLILRRAIIIPGTHGNFLLATVFVTPFQSHYSPTFWCVHTLRK